MGEIEPLYRQHLQDKLSEVSVIHGDLCLANILYDPKNRIIKLIDPRGKFGDFSLHGDFRYELAKLSHSFNGHYESIINDRFSVDLPGECIINYEIHSSEKQRQITDLFNKRLRRMYAQHLDAIDLIEALLFLSMIPLHLDSYNRQKVMLAQGIEKIDAVLQRSA